MEGKMSVVVLRYKLTLLFGPNKLSCQSDPTDCISLKQELNS